MRFEGTNEVTILPNLNRIVLSVAEIQRPKIALSDDSDPIDAALARYHCCRI